MHEIYENEGKYDFLYQMPTILYTTLISSIIGFVFEYLALSEDYIISIRDTSNTKKENTIEKILKINKCLKIRFTLFYILNFLFLLFIWYYVSCFGVVYKNTQIHVIKDTILSFVLSLLYPIGQCLLPGIFRIPSLRAAKQDKKCLYKFSQFIENISSFLTDC